MKLFLNFLFGILICATTVSAEEPATEPPVHMPYNARLAMVKNSILNIADQVDGNCWTNAESIRAKIYLLFEQSGVFVFDYQPAFFNWKTVDTSLGAFGFRTASGICVVSAEFTVQTYITQTIGGIYGTKQFGVEYVASIFEKEAIFTNSSNVNAQLVDFFDGAASQFSAERIAAQRGSEFREFSSNFPDNGEPPMSVDEWHKLLSESDVEQE